MRSLRRKIAGAAVLALALGAVLPAGVASAAPSQLTDRGPPYTSAVSKKGMPASICAASA